MRKNYYDFHFHSLFSDGSMTVDEIFSAAKEKGLKALALTDHDTVLGIPQEHQASRKYGISYIPAAEFTAREVGIKFHVLGYGIQPDNSLLVSYSNKLLDYMNRRSKKQIEKMQSNGIAIPTEEFFLRASGGPLYRGKLLGVLADYGYLEKDQIMKLIPEYFSTGAPYYEEDEFPYGSFEEVCSMIHSSGGIAVLAHPAKIRKKNIELFEKLIQSPLLDGLEVYHPDNPPEIRARLLLEAMKRKLIVTGGSDFHGIYMKMPLEIGGEFVPDECADSLSRYLCW